MKNLKSALAVIAALCLMMCLTVPVFATESVTTTAAPAATEATTGETVAETTGETTAQTEEEGFEGAQQPGAAEEEGDIHIPLNDETTPDTETEEEHNHVHAEEAEEETAGHKALRIVLIVLEVIASVALIIVVLVQSGKESGLSGAISGNSDSYMGKGKGATMDKKLASMTKWIALVWVALTLVLSMI